MKKYLLLVAIFMAFCTVTNAHATKHDAGTTCPPCLTADNGDCQAPCKASDSVAVRPSPHVGRNQSIFDRWGVYKTNESCKTGGGVWVVTDGKGACTSGKGLLK